MIATLSFLKEKFEYYNNLIFEGKLPTPTFELMKTKTTLGQFQYCMRNTIFGNGKEPKYFIRLSTFYDRQENDLCETIVHEMVHFWVSFNKLPDNGHHGRIWTMKANEINKKYGFHISRCSSIEGCDINPIYAKKLEDKPVMMFAYYKNNRWFTFASSIDNATKFIHWIIDNVKHKNMEKACYGHYKRDKNFNYTICRTRVHGWYKTPNEFESEIYPNIIDVTKINY